MKKVTSLQQIQEVINSKGDFFHEVHGRTYNLNVVSVLQMTLIDVITMIKDGKLFYEHGQ